MSKSRGSKKDVKTEGVVNMAELISRMRQPPLKKATKKKATKGSRKDSS